MWSGERHHSQGRRSDPFSPSRFCYPEISQPRCLCKHDAVYPVASHSLNSGTPPAQLPISSHGPDPKVPRRFGTSQSWFPLSSSHLVWGVRGRTSIRFLSGPANRLYLVPVPFSFRQTRFTKGDGSCRSEIVKDYPWTAISGLSLPNKRQCQWALGTRFTWALPVLD